MNELDWILVAVFAACAIRCAFRGVVKELMGLAAFVAASIAAVLFFYPVELVAREYVSLGWASAPLSFLVVFVAVFVAMKIVEKSLREALEAAELKSLDRALGALLGAAEGLALVCGILLVTYMQPFVDASPVLEGSILARNLLPLLTSSFGKA